MRSCSRRRVSPLGTKALLPRLTKTMIVSGKLMFGQPLTEPFVVFIDFLLGQLYEVFVLAFGGAEDQRIIFKQGCISLRDYAFLSAHNENDSRLGRKRNVADAAPIQAEAHPVQRDETVCVSVLYP